jgi:hypothetical protein
MNSPLRENSAGYVELRRYGVRPGPGFGVGLVAGISVLIATNAAHSGPCADEIAQLERQIAASVPGPQSGPTAPQSLGAQLHRQPTPQSVQRAERVGNKDGEEALARAKTADAQGNAADCNAALLKARELYGF